MKVNKKFIEEYIKEEQIVKIEEYFYMCFITYNNYKILKKYDNIAIYKIIKEFKNIGITDDFLYFATISFI